MVAGLRGYDPVDTDPFSDGQDPGIKKQMFLPTKAAEDGTTRFDMQNFILAQDDLRCEAQVTTQRFSNFEKYENYKQLSRSFDSNQQDSSEANFFFWKSSLSSLKRSSERSKTEDIIKFFKEAKGEIYVTEASCQTYTMEIEPYVPLVFTDGFTSALRSLEFAASQPKDSKLANRLFSTFVKNYGTHFISGVAMGAKLWIETRYSSKSVDRGDISKRMECIQNSLRTDSSAGFETPEVTFEAGIEAGIEAEGASGSLVSAKASTKMQAIKLGSSSGSNSNRNKCSNDNNNSNYFRNNALEETVIRSVGTRSTDLEKWVTDEFVPAPIKYTIKPMTEIFKPIFESWNPDGNLGTILARAGDEEGPKLNSTKIHDFFLTKVKQYCDIILGNRNCPNFDTKGCGINDICPLGKLCSDDKDSNLGFKCADLPSQCPPQNYNVLQENNRNKNFKKVHGKAFCDDETWNSDGGHGDWKGPDHYRMKRPAGTRIPENAPPWKHCGTGSPGWLRGKHPIHPGEEKSGTICFSIGSNTCSRKRSITITNCDGYFVYNMTKVPACTLRYCAE